MTANDLQTYSANIHRGIAAAFMGEKLGAHAYPAIQAPHTLTYPFRLAVPTVSNVNRALKLNRAIEATTNVSPVRITTESGVIMIEVPSPSPVVIRGATLAGGGLSVPIGMSSRRAIVGVDFEIDSHLLIVGATNGGKTVAAKNIVYQLLRQNTDEEIQVIVSCFKRKNWEPFAPFAQIITDMDETIQMLRCARELMYLRAKTGSETPRYFIILDDCLNLFALDGVNEIMSELLPLARGCGINFILISQRLAGMDRKVTGNCTSRLLFSVADTADSGIVGGRSDLGAENLGRYPGDCLLIANEGVQRVATALVQNEDIAKLATVKSWFRTSLQTNFAIEKSDFATVSVQKSKQVSEMAENAENTHTLAKTDLRLQSLQTRLQGKPKSDVERNFVREMYQQCGGNINATMRAVWGSVGSYYKSYVQECISEQSEAGYGI